MTKVASLTPNRLFVPGYLHKGFIFWLLPCVALLSRISDASGTCGGDFVSDEGPIISPNFPNNYNDSQNCVYKITVPEGQKIFLSFSYFQIEKHSSCSYDKVTIYDGGDLSSTRLGTFCGFTIPESIISSGNKLTIEFNSDSSNHYKGFSAKYNRLSCEGIFTASEGTISSPNFPGLYNARDRCIYKITVPDNNVVLLTFEDFQLEYEENCLFDSLKIYDGDENDRRLGIYCGSIAPNPILSSGNKVTITFYSDSTKQFKGFSLKFKKGTCDRNIVANEGTIFSPNFPSDYDDNARCTYKIIVPEDYVIRLTFETFKLESTCSYDYIKIRDGHELSSSVIGPFCGATVPGPIISSGRKLAIEFRTDHSNHHKGFSAKFERVPSSKKLCPMESTKWKDLGSDSDYCYITEKNEELIWNDALYKCYQAGGSLASFHSEAELNKVLNVISEDPFYIGLRENGDGTFEWADQSPLDYTNWKSGEPNTKSEMCVYMYADYGNWNDIDCSRNYRYICSSRKAVRSSFDSGLEKVCPQSSTKWRDYGGNNCYIIETEKYTWDQAEERCEQEGGHLASFHSAEEVNILHPHTKSVGTHLHIGLQQMTDGSFKWVDKSVVDFLNWNYDEPNSASEKCSETLQGKGLWNDIPCTKSLGYICSTPKVYSGSTLGGLNMACIGTSDGWSDFGGDFCYVIRDQSKEWDEANNACIAVGGNLASFKSLTEMKRVVSHLNPNGGNLHIGLKRSSAGSSVFEWVDHSKVNFLNWNDGEPNTLAEECSEMYQGNAKWNDIQCSKLQHYICSRPKVPSCSGNVCMNGGVCTESYSIPPRCDCSPYYKGLQCEQDVTCDDIPCKNGATCRKSSTEYICACAHGYTGHDCETKVLCSANPCENLGTCTEDRITGVFKCACMHGYKGLRCEEKILCTADSCGNSGTCTQDGTNGVFRCTCAHGYQGLTCGEKILCSSDPCNSSGTCSEDGPNGIFRCACKHGYQGLTCAEKIMCQEETCINAGLCTQDGENGVFRCTCDHGYEGQTCEEKILCESDTCENEGSCTQDGVNGVFRCNCKHGYQGFACEEKILCGTDTCAYEGICTQDGINGVFMCKCEHGYRGMRCEERILCENDTCNNEGICSQDGINGVFTCTCQHGYQGLICEETILCENGTCENEGLCTQDGQDGVFRCTCPHGYQGLSCKEMILCSNNTCENDGACTNDGVNDVFRCTCKHGYRGVKCEEKILCENDTCENEGLCTQDGINDVFRCTCKHGYKGLICEEKILCASGTCANGGTCIQEGIDVVFRCECQSGYQGLTCEEKILCTGDTCKNGGTCLQDGEEGIFRCECGAGYGGLTCEDSNFDYSIQRVGDKEYVLRGNVVLDIEADIVIH